MIKWEDLTFFEKAAFLTVIGVVGCFSPEIALLFHFGGVEVVFAFVAFYFLPILRQVHGYYLEIRTAFILTVSAYQTSTSAQPKVYFVQATFCSLAFVLTGSVALSAAFLLPGLVGNSLLV